MRATDNRKQADAECSGTGGVYMTALSKDDDRYVFLWTDAQVNEVLRRVQSFAENPELNLTDEDAEFLTVKVRERAVGKFEDRQERQRDRHCAAGGTPKTRSRWRAAIGLLLWFAGMAICSALERWMETR